MYKFIFLVLLNVFYSSAEDERKSIKECHFVRNPGRLKLESSYRQFFGIEFVECQTYCQNLQNCKSFSYGLAENGTSECLLAERSSSESPNILRPLSRADIDFEPTDFDRFYVYEKSNKGCIELAFECLTSSILVNIQTSNIFDGLVYTEGTADPGCIVDIVNKTNFAISVPIEDLQCNSVYNGDGEFSNIIVVQWDDRIVTRKDRRFRISCQYNLGDMKITHKPFGIQNLSPLSMMQKVPQPETFIRLLAMNGKELTEASVGEPTMFRIEMADSSSPYRIFARECKAIGEKDTEVLELIDADGCPVYKEVFPALKKVGPYLEARFQTFRFRTSYSVTFQCIVDYCIDSCEPVNCDGDSQSMGRKKRSIVHSNFVEFVRNKRDTNDIEYQIRRSIYVTDPKWGESKLKSYKSREGEVIKVVSRLGSVSNYPSRSEALMPIAYETSESKNYEPIHVQPTDVSKLNENASIASNSNMIIILISVCCFFSVLCIALAVTLYYSQRQSKSSFRPYAATYPSSTSSVASYQEPSHMFN